MFSISEDHIIIKSIYIDKKMMTERQKQTVTDGDRVFCRRDKQPCRKAAEVVEHFEEGVKL